MLTKNQKVEVLEAILSEVSAENDKQLENVVSTAKGQEAEYAQFLVECMARGIVDKGGLIAEFEEMKAEIAKENASTTVDSSPKEVMDNAPKEREFTTTSTHNIVKEYLDVLMDYLFDEHTDHNTKVIAIAGLLHQATYIKEAEQRAYVIGILEAFGCIKDLNTVKKAFEANVNLATLPKKFRLVDETPEITLIRLVMLTGSLFVEEDNNMYVIDYRSLETILRDKDVTKLVFSLRPDEEDEGEIGEEGNDVNLTVANTGEIEVKDGDAILATINDKIYFGTAFLIGNDIKINTNGEIRNPDAVVLDTPEGRKLLFEVYS